MSVIIKLIRNFVVVFIRDEEREIGECGMKRNEKVKKIERKMDRWIDR